MTSFILKIIAIISMTFDHVGNSIFKGFSSFNYIGRLAFPIFAYQISEGFKHTKDIKKYFFRLLVFAFISQVPHMLFLSTYTTNIYKLNIFFTLLIGLLGIIIYNKIINFPQKYINKLSDNQDNLLKKFLGIAIAITLAAIAEFLDVDYGAFGVVIIFIFYLFRDNKIYMSISFILACAIYYGNLMIINEHYYEYSLLCLSTIIPVIFFWLYNGKQGLKIKYLMYLYYPLHQLILYFLFK